MRACAAGVSLFRHVEMATGSGGDLPKTTAQLQDQIRLQGDVVRQMKKDKKPKEEVLNCVL